MKEWKAKIKKKLHAFIADPRIRIKFGNYQTRLVCVTAKKWLYYYLVLRFTFIGSRRKKTEKETQNKRKVIEYRVFCGLGKRWNQSFLRTSFAGIRSNCAFVAIRRPNRTIFRMIHRSFRKKIPKFHHHHNATREKVENTVFIATKKH